MDSKDQLRFLTVAGLHPSLKTSCAPAVPLESLSQMTSKTANNLMLLRFGPSGSTKIQVVKGKLVYDSHCECMLTDVP